MNPPPLMHGFDWQGESLEAWLLSEKCNGWRAAWNGTELLTRSGAKYDAPAWFTAGLPKDTPLDCELHAGRNKTNDDVCSAVRCGRWEDLKLAIFDVPERGLAIEAALERIAALPLPPHAQPLQYHRAESNESAWRFARDIVADGGEGAVARRPNSRYFPTRTANVLKLKPTPKSYEQKTS